MQFAIEFHFYYLVGRKGPMDGWQLNQILQMAIKKGSELTAVSNQLKYLHSHTPLAQGFDSTVLGCLVPVQLEQGK